MRIGNFSVWMSRRQAAEMGFTHHARIFGIIPGFIGNPESDCPTWTARSDLLIPLEDMLGIMVGALCATMGEEPVFSFSVGKRIAA